MFKKNLLSFILCVVIVFSPIDAFAVSPGDIELSAKSAVSYSPLTHEIVYEKNCHEHLPMASTTKIMTALIVYEKLNLNDEITVTEQDSQTEGSSSGLKTGDTVSIRDLIYCMLLPSGNDAANAGARAVSGNLEDFALLMNEKAREIGMNDTHFATPSGLDAPEHYSSAYDLALLASRAIDIDFLREVFSSVTHTVETKQGIKYYLTNHNRLLKSIEGCCGVKTGFTKKSGRCLVSAAERDSLTLITVTLNAPDDWNDHKTLIEHAFDCVYTYKSGKTETHINVTGSDVKNICASAVIPEIKTFTDISQNSRIRITAQKFLYAPVDETVVCGKAELIYKNRVIYSTNLFSQTPANVKRISGEDEESRKCGFVKFFKDKLKNYRGKTWLKK